MLTVSDELRRLADACRRPPVTFRSLLGAMSAREHALLTLFLGLCFLHPFPMPGVSTIIGAVIVVAGARMACGLGPWIPERWRDRALPADALAGVLGRAASIVSRLERGAHGPTPWMENRGVRTLNGALTGVCGALIMLPLPPPTNFPPALALVVLSLAILRQRPLLLAAGYLAVLGNAALFGALIAGAGAATRWWR